MWLHLPILRILNYIGVVTGSNAYDPSDDTEILPKKKR